MRKPALLLLICLLSLLFTHCSKGGSGGETPPAPEENLSIALEPDLGGAVAKAMGTSYDVKLLIKSKMPPQGVSVSIAYRMDADNTMVFSQNLQTSVSPLMLTINNIPFNEMGTVGIEVKSKTKETNTASKNFKLVRK